MLRSLGKKNDARYNLKIIDTDKPESERYERSERSEQQDAPRAASDEPSTTPVETLTEQVVEEVPEESDLASKTRKELADLDDLDI